MVLVCHIIRNARSAALCCHTPARMAIPMLTAINKIFYEAAGPGQSSSSSGAHDSRSLRRLHTRAHITSLRKTKLTMGFDVMNSSEEAAS